MITYCEDVTDFGHVVSVIEQDRKFHKRFDDSMAKIKMTYYERYKRKNKNYERMY